MDHAAQYLRAAGELFDQWQAMPPKDGIDHRSGGFVRDGVVCPEIWFSQQVRPLFLLKEAYGDGRDWDLIDDHLLTAAPFGNHLTWKRVTQWAQGILGTTADRLCPFDERTRGLGFGNAYLRRIAAVNVKKSGGRSASNAEEIARYARNDRALLCRQLELIDPTVIVCGNTFEYLEIILDARIKNTRNPNLGYSVRLNGHDVIVLDYWHPSNRYPDLMNYYGLVASYQQALALSASCNFCQSIL